ncbi:hypothetical protein Tco_0813769 [Tanacetum coccineum]
MTLKHGVLYKKALSLKEAEKEITNNDSDDEAHVTGSMVEPSRTKKLKNFDFITEDGTHIHLTEEEINHQKKLKEDAKAEAAKQEGEVWKSKLVDPCPLLVLGHFMTKSMAILSHFYSGILVTAVSRMASDV